MIRDDTEYSTLTVFLCEKCSRREVHSLGIKFATGLRKIIAEAEEATVIVEALLALWDLEEVAGR